MHMYTVRLQTLDAVLLYWVLGLGLTLRMQNASGRSREHADERQLYAHVYSAFACSKYGVGKLGVGS